VVLAEGGAVMMEKFEDHRKLPRAESWLISSYRSGGPSQAELSQATKICHMKMQSGGAAGVNCL